MSGSMALSVSQTVVVASNRSDHDLVRQAQAGRGEAREELAHRFRQSAYLLALQLLGNRDEALDVAQESMLRFFVSLERFSPDRPVRPWLLTIVRNQVRDLWRRQGVRRTESLDATPDLSRTLTDPSSTPEDLARRSQLRRRIWSSMSRMTPKGREILVLRDFHDLSYAEIAEVLSIPLGTVMSQLHGARTQLRTLLEGGLNDV